MNAYEILECDQEATQDQLKVAYHRLLLVHHPDKQIEAQNDVESFLKIQSAYKLLSNPSQRANYDSLLKELALKEKANQFGVESDSVSLLLEKDFDYRDGVYSCECARCGGIYSVTKIEIQDLLKELVNTDTTDTQSLIAALQCNTCSLITNVLII